GFHRAEAGRRLPRIERCAGRVAVDVDHRARNRGADHGYAQAGGEIIERHDPPIGVAPAEPGRHQPVFDPREIRAGMRDRNEERRVALHDAEPAGMRVHPATPGKSIAPAAAISAPERTSALAASMSGWKWRSSSRCGT